MSHTRGLVVFAALIWVLTAGVVTAQVAGQGGGVYFSTSEEFVTQGPEPADGNPIISDGDLLKSDGLVYMRNRALLQVHNISYDLGLDAVFVADEDTKLVAFSTELDGPRGVFTAGDLLITNGAVIPNVALLNAFGVDPALDLGLDALHITGDKSAIAAFFAMVATEPRDFWVANPQQFRDMARSSGIDIHFSTEGTHSPAAAAGFLDGDLLSITGVVVEKNSDLLHLSVPAGIPMRGVDFGVDATTIMRDPIEGVDILLHSTEINGRLGWFTDGDALAKGNGVIFSAPSLVTAFEPKVKDIGLDALCVITEDPQTGEEGRLTKIGGVDVNPTTWDASNGLCDPNLTGVKDHTFGAWVSVRGVLPSDSVRHRVLFRPDGGGDSPILMPANIGGPFGWRVYNHPFSVWQSVVIEGDGWMDTSYWNYLKGFCQNPDLIFVNWYTTKGGTPDGKYILTLQCVDTGGTTKTVDSVAVRIDNTRPDVALDDNNECHEFIASDMPLSIDGAVSDEHFSNFNLSLNSHWISPTSFEDGYYQDGPPLGPTGTLGFPTTTTLSLLDIPAVLGAQARDGRYTVWLWAYDRSMIGAFGPKTNHISDANPSPSDRDDRNWNHAITNFEFHP